MSAAVYVFDAYGTLFDVNSAVARYKEDIGASADRLAEMWRIKQLEYAWTLSLIGRWQDFRALTADALETAAEMAGGLPEGLRAKLLESYETLDAYADVAPTLMALRAQGARTAILSNGSAAMLEAMTRAAGLADLFDAVLSVDPLQTYKPMPAVYGLVGERFETKPMAVSFQSSNRWDIAGARAFGFRTVWVNRGGKPDEYRDLPPDRVVTSLDALV